MANNSKREYTVFTKNWFNNTQYSNSIVDAALAFNKFLHDEFEVVQDYLYLNMTVIRCDERDIKKLGNHKAFKSAITSTYPIKDFHRVLYGLNALQNQYMYQVYEWWFHRKNGVTLPNNRFEGGIYPAGDYPATPKSKHLVRELRKYECPPAYMPVLNLSIGPEYARNTHVDHALQILSETRLLTISAGNDGRPAGNQSSINKFIRDEPHNGILVVGATDESGDKLADYSSTGLKNEKYRRPCIVARPGKITGTSFAAPKVANLACVCFDAIFQIANVECTSRSDKAAGVPLVGWGLIDKLEGELGLPGRADIPAMPFLGVFEKELRDAFSILHKKDLVPVFSVHGPPIRRLILDCARKLNGYERHEVGSGFVSQELLLDYLANLHLGKILSMFCDNVSSVQIPAAVWNLKVFDRDELSELAEIGQASRPIWAYDYLEPKFIVNRIDGGVLAPIPNSHGGQVAAAGAGIV